MAAQVDQALLILSQIMEDRTVPRNIRELVGVSKERLLGEEREVGIDAAVQILDSVTNDSNLPIYTRTQIWNVVSLLESST